MINSQINLNTLNYFYNSSRSNIFSIVLLFGLFLCLTKPAYSQSMITGFLYEDVDEDCIREMGENGLSNIVVQLVSDQTEQYTLTDSIGYYQFEVDLGTHVVVPNIPTDSPYNLWNPTCPENTIVVELTEIDTVRSQNLGYNAFLDCPILSVEMGLNFLRRCYDNTIYVAYANEGSAMATDSYVEILLDDDVVLDSASVNYELGTEPNLYVFDIGDLEATETGEMELYVAVNCEAVLGSTSCMEANIYPNDFCGQISSLWDGSDIEVWAVCEMDSVVFYIQNTGEDMAESRLYTVYEDDLLQGVNPFDLDANEVLSFSRPATGATYRLEAEQSPYYPGNSQPSVTIEGCGDINASSLGFVTTSSPDDLDPYIDVDCYEIIDAFEPNAKSVSPSGLLEQHFVDFNELLEYTIRFQNTGNGTVSSVTVIDTLSEFLDFNTFEQGLSSHDYTLTFLSDRVVKWEFENILLPDSTTNFVGSNGFVSFRIRVDAAAPQNTIVHNTANIYFDMEAPIQTPNVFVTVGCNPANGTYINVENNCNTFELDWETSLGGSSTDIGQSIQQTSDGGFIAIGRSISTDGNVSDPINAGDAWLVKLNENGVLDWEKSIGSNGTEVGYSLDLCNDGGYIVAGFRQYYSVDEQIIQTDYWAAKLDASGNIEWDKTYGGSKDDRAYSVVQTLDGGFILAGGSRSSDGDVGGSNGVNFSDFWVVKLDPQGTIEWEQNYGGSFSETATSIQATTDGGYIIGGHTNSDDGDVNGNNGQTDYWVVKIDAVGVIEWEQNYGGSKYDLAQSILQSGDGGYMVAGYSSSENGDITSHILADDYWLVKLDNTGNIQWDKSVGGTSSDIATSVIQTKDCNYVVAGWTNSNLTNNQYLSNSDGWIAKISQNGNLIFDQSFGGTSEDKIHSIIETETGVAFIGSVKAESGFDNYWIGSVSETDYICSNCSDPMACNYDPMVMPSDAPNIEENCIYEQILFQDLDGDGLGNPAVDTTSCYEVLNYVDNSDDTDDNCNLDCLGVCNGTAVINDCEECVDSTNPLFNDCECDGFEFVYSVICQVDDTTDANTTYSTYNLLIVLATDDFGSGYQITNNITGESIFLTSPDEYYSIILSHTVPQGFSYDIFQIDNPTCKEKISIAYVSCTAGLNLGLTDIEINTTPSGNELNWNLSSAQDGQYFVIERSDDGTTFEPIETLSINNNQNNSFSYLDKEDTQNCTMYYRIKWLDAQNNLLRTSAAQEHNKCTDNKPVFVQNIYPNPTASNITVTLSLPYKGSLYLRLLNIYGEPQFTQKTDLESGSPELQIDISALPVGQYLLESHFDGQTAINKIVKW